MRKPVTPSAMMLSAVPETTCSIRRSIDANAWMSEKRAPETTATTKPIHTAPSGPTDVPCSASVTTVPKKAPMSIMPSSAMLTTPERSQIVPPMAASARCVAMRIAEANRSGFRTSLSMCGHPPATLQYPVGDERLRGHEEDDERLDDRH